MGETPRILALDLSLTASGIAYPDGSVDLLRPRTAGTERLAALRDHLRDLVLTLEADRLDLVVIEGYAFGRTNKAHHIGELGGVIRLLMHDLNQPWCEIPPASVKKYATGKGNANKQEMLAAAIRRLGYDGADDNQADALWLRAMALDHLGAPVVTVPAHHLTGMDKVAWPEQVPA